MANDQLVLGADVATLRVKLTTGADFTSTLQYQDASGTATNWPAGTSVSLVFGSTTWAATISGSDAIFAVDKAAADTVEHRTPVTLVYTNGTTDEVWARGTVVRNG